MGQTDRGELIQLAAPDTSSKRLKRTLMTTTLIQQGPAYELSVTMDTSRHGHHLRFVSFVPTARNPEPQVRFQTTLSAAELRALHDAICQALFDRASPGSGSSCEPVAQ